MENLKQCPACCGRAEILQFPVANDQLWQVSCRECGLATELDDERYICVQHWNRRDKEERQHYLLTLLGILLPISMIMMFFLGVLVGAIDISTEISTDIAPPS